MPEYEFSYSVIHAQTIWLHSGGDLGDHMWKMIYGFGEAVWIESYELLDVLTV